LLDKSEPSQFAFLSAMVGSIGDNRLGGWYGYRSSKAALNMIVKTASIEVSRSNKMAAFAVIHPGTTIGSLSKPFASGIPKNKYYTAEQSASRILSLTESLTPEQSGSFFNWDGSHLPW
jgi:NAD(P)-dependent dehydrogenase (short-subunit alcohol dehydrogenase family)